MILQLGFRKTRRVEQVFFYVSVIIILFVFLVPILWMLLVSLKTMAQLYMYPPRVIFKPTLKNYIKAFRVVPLAHSLINSIIISTSAASLALLFGMWGAYALSRIRFRGRFVITQLILGSQILPPVALIVPMFLLFFKIRMVGTYQAQILANTSFALPFAIFMLMQFINDLPEDLENAAMVDGCTRFGALMRVVMPLITPGMAGTWILSLIFSWNNFVVALALGSRNTNPLPMTLISFETDRGIDFTAASAAGLITVIPVFILVLLTQRFIVRGLTKGAFMGE
jgi:multiple sugar transport system permease protein